MFASEYDIEVYPTRLMYHVSYPFRRHSTILGNRIPSGAIDFNSLILPWARVVYFIILFILVSDRGGTSWWSIHMYDILSYTCVLILASVRGVASGESIITHVRNFTCSLYITSDLVLRNFSRKLHVSQYVFLCNQ